MSPPRRAGRSTSTSCTSPTRADVLAARVGADRLDEPLQPVRRHVVGDMVPQPHRGRALPDRVLEGVGIVEVGIGHQAQRLGELGIRLAGEADDDVGGEGDARDRSPEPRDHLEVDLAGIAPEHAAEHRVGAALHRQVHVLAHRRRFGHGLHDAIREIGRIRAGEPHPAHPVHRPDGPEQVGEVVLAVVIRVDRLPQKRDLGGAGRRQLTTSRTTSPRRRLRSGPRVCGTMQKVQR